MNTRLPPAPFLGRAIRDARRTSPPPLIARPGTSGSFPGAAGADPGHPAASARSGRWRGRFTRALFLVAGVLALAALPSCSGNGPSDSALLDWLNRQHEGRAVFTELEQESAPGGDGTVLIHLQATGRPPEALYSPLDTPWYLEHRLKLDHQTLMGDLPDARGADRAAMLQAAGVAETMNLYESRVVKVSTPAGTVLAYASEVSARREKGGWVFTEQAGGFVGPEPAGSPLKTFPGRVFVADEPKDDAALRRLAAEQIAFNQRLAVAYAGVLKERLERRRSQLAPFLAHLKAGKFFGGQFLPAYGGQPGPVVMEITDTDPAAGSFHATLRNDGGWRDLRFLAGTWSKDLVGGALAVTVSGGPGDKPVSRGGPVLGLERDLGMQGRLSMDGSFVLENPDFQLKLAPLPPAEVDALRSAHLTLRQHLLTPVQSGCLYRGEARPRNDPHGWPIQIRFTEQDPARMTVSAVLESPGNPTFSRILQGSLIDHRYRAESHPLRLTLHKIDAVRTAPAYSVFSHPYDLFLQLAFEGDALVGNDDTYIYRLRRVSPPPTPVALGFLADAAAERGGAGPTQVELPYPTQPGLFALLEGRWAPLPRNSGKVVVRSSPLPAPVHRDEDFELCFTGHTPLPCLPGRDLHLVFRGPPLDPNMGAPEHFPAAQAALTFPTLDGARRTPVHAVSGNLHAFSGINDLSARSKWVEADVLRIELTDLPAGTFAVLVGTEAFEFEVK